MIPFDTKDYRAKREILSTPGFALIGIVALLALLGWMDERDHQAKVEQIKLAAVKQCY